MGHATCPSSCKRNPKSVQNDEDYICITGIARYKGADRTDYRIQNWIRNRNTIEFLGIWEQLNNPDFNPVEFDGFRKQAVLNSFTLTPKQWIEKTHARGIVSKPGRYGGTFTYKDIAFEFASWISVEFKLYLIKEFNPVSGYDILYGKVKTFIKTQLFERPPQNIFPNIYQVKG